MSVEKQNLIEENLKQIFNEDFLMEMLSAEDFQNYNSVKQILKFHKGDTIF